MMAVISLHRGYSDYYSKINIVRKRAFTGPDTANSLFALSFPTRPHTATLSCLPYVNSGIPLNKPYDN
uniref:Uncharacterized protein n=1 Tax=Anguilla anguilla TaxID=7936 RepID=A0A0E9XAW8_ANGAN